MDSESSVSTFWSNFYTVRKKSAKKELLWNRFRSPYDTSLCAESPTTPSSSSGPSCHRKATNTVPPEVPCHRKSGGDSRSSLSLSLTKRLFSGFSTLQYQRKSGSTTPKQSYIRASNDSLVENTKWPTEGKLRASKSADSLADRFIWEKSGWWRSGNRVSDTSKSTDELIKVRNKWLEKLDQCKVYSGSSKSDETLNVDYGLLTDPHGALLSKISPRASSSLRQIQKCVCQSPSLNLKPWNVHTGRERAPKEDLKSDQKFEDANSLLDTEKLAERQYRRNPREDIGKRDMILTMSDTHNHPPLTVCPGHRLARSRSCTRSSYPVVSSYTGAAFHSLSPNNRASSCVREMSEVTHADRDRGLRIRRSRSCQRSKVREEFIREKEASSSPTLHTFQS
nr:uncharacterized protein LOC128693272 [Cherax quadricarinatus]